MNTPILSLRLPANAINMRNPVTLLDLPNLGNPLLFDPTKSFTSSGLLDVQRPTQPAPSAPTQNILHRIGGAFSAIMGGADDPNLTPEQNAAARRAASIRAGLATILASAPAPVKPGIMQVLAQGALAGQQVGESTRAQYGVQNHHQLMSALTSGTIDLPTLKKMFAQAMSAGDTEAAKAISTVIQSASAAENAGNGQVLEMIDPATGKPGKFLVDGRGHLTPLGAAVPPASTSAPGHITMLDPKTRKPTVYAYKDGQYVAIGEAPPTSQPQRERWQVASGQDANGKPVMGRLNLDTGAFEPIKGVTPKQSAEDPRIAMGQGQMQLAQQTLAKYEADLSARSGFMSSRGLVGNYFNTEAGQAVKQAGAMFVDAVLLAHKIGRPSDKLREMYIHTFVPEAGDLPNTLALKAAARAAAAAGTLPPSLRSATEAAGAASGVLRGESISSALDKLNNLGRAK